MCWIISTRTKTSNSTSEARDEPFAISDGETEAVEPEAEVIEDATEAESPVEIVDDKAEAALAEGVLQVDLPAVHRRRIAVDRRRR